MPSYLTTDLEVVMVGVGLGVALEASQSLRRQRQRQQGLISGDGDIAQAWRYVHAQAE